MVYDMYNVLWKTCAYKTWDVLLVLKHIYYLACFPILFLINYHGYSHDVTASHKYMYSWEDLFHYPYQQSSEHQTHVSHETYAQKLDAK